MEDDKRKEEMKDLLEDAKKIKEEFKLESIDTALLMILNECLDTIRFHNTD